MSRGNVGSHSEENNDQECHPVHPFKPHNSDPCFACDTGNHQQRLTQKIK